jgi:hypothetical protein
LVHSNGFRAVILSDGQELQTFEPLISSERTRITWIRRSFPRYRVDRNRPEEKVKAQQADKNDQTPKIFLNILSPLLDMQYLCMHSPIAEIA